MAAAKVLVIEDEHNIADFIERGLTQVGFDVQTASNGVDGLQAALKGEPDIVVLDLMLPDVDGFEVCRRLRAEGDVGIIMLTARQGVGDRVRGLEAGADDYLPKPFAFEELRARVRSVLRRRGRGETALRVADLEVDTLKRSVRRAGRDIELTNREFELLELLALNAGRPLRREVILQKVWGYDFEGEQDPVKVYVNYLRKKLNAEGEPDLIQSLRGFGYVLKEQS
ncbi:MAG: response regulator transcription factor [Chloroflexi bacterium]|nr:response regulator transcription factor [Chloroflexota bacterium]